MGFTKKIEQYMSTETVYYKDGVEIARFENCDAHWYDTQSVESISDEEGEDYL